MAKMIQKNLVKQWIAIVTCSPQLLSPYMETLSLLEGVHRVCHLVWQKTTPTGKQVCKGAGTDLQSEIENMLIVYIDTADAGKPKLRPEHAPYNYKKYMEGNQQELQSK